MSTIDAQPIAQENQTTIYPDPASKEMIEAGVFFGRKKSRTHPKMKQYVLTNRSGMEIINLAKTAECLAGAAGFVKEKVSKGGLVLLVGTEPQAEAGIRSLAERFSLPCITQSWAGGTLTNFKVISKRIGYMKKLREDFSTSAFDKYTKKERLGIEKELQRLVDLFGGLENLTRLPEAIILINAHAHEIVLREARRLGIPVVALANVDADPALIDYLVPGNDKSRKSIDWFLSKISSAIEEGKTVAKATAEQIAVQPATAMESAEK